MGVAIAEAARDRRAEVTLVAGPISTEPPQGVRLVAVRTAAEMETAMLEVARKADLVLMAAAVADYRPAKMARDKITRGSARLILELEPNPDILARLAAQRRGKQVLVGFALETSGGVARARKKLKAKAVDLIVLNSPRDAIGRDTNRVTLVEPRSTKKLPELSKREVAEHILDRALSLRGSVRGVRRLKNSKHRGTP